MTNNQRFLQLRLLLGQGVSSLQAASLSSIRRLSQPASPGIRAGNDFEYKANNPKDLSERIFFDCILFAIELPSFILYLYATNSHACNRRACVECATVATRGQHSDFIAGSCSSSLKGKHKRQL